VRPAQLLGEHALRLSAVTTSEVSTESAWRGQSARDVLQGELVVHGELVFPHDRGRVTYQR
jgi:hypothetical protein